VDVVMRDCICSTWRAVYYYYLQK